MGVRAGVVVCVTSFLLGALFTHWIADSLTLWKSPVTDEHLWTAAAYYSILARSPPQVLWLLGSVVVTGCITILWSLGDGEAGNIMFDGGSIFLFGVTVVMYLYSVFPSPLLFSICLALPDLPADIFANFGALSDHQPRDPFPSSLRLLTLQLASNNLVCSVALTGVLALQAGRFWAENSDADDEVSVPGEGEGSQSRAKTPEPHTK
ncbi:hypothetical protein H2248_009524 [Termitomyces sp. 'cryptogamus']|nr:hypothetical protein H2248_009524 [Termitomyces sp. 'cryptogamus']